MIRTPNVPPAIMPIMNITAPIFVFPFCFDIDYIKGFQGDAPDKAVVCPQTTMLADR